jgi:hypothetical protein
MNILNLAYGGDKTKFDRHGQYFYKGRMKKHPLTTPIRPGLWVTEGGSRLLLNIDDEGLVSGSYSTSHGRPDPDERFAVTGQVNHDLIGLICSWGRFRSMTSWCGRYYREGDRDTIHYMWHLAREFEDADNTVPTDITFTFHTMSGIFYFEKEL